MEFIFTKHFNKKYEKLDRKIKEQFKKRREMVAIDPKHPLLNVHSLHGDYKERFSMNVTGDYRAVFHWVDKSIIRFVTIGTHGELYK